MLKFHVDLHSSNPDQDSHDVKFHAIVDAETAADARQRAIEKIKKEQPDMIIKPHWEWEIYEIPLG